MKPRTRKTVKKTDIIAKKQILHKELLDLFDRCKKKHASYSIRRKFNRSGVKKIGKRQNLTKNDLAKATELNNKLLDDLKKIPKLRRIKNYNSLTKEDLIYTLLRSEKTHLEDNYMKYLNIIRNNEIKINNTRMVKARLNNLSNEEKKIIRDELHKIENTQQFTKKKKEKTLAYLFRLLNTLDNKEKHQNIDRHDPNYYGIRGIEHIFNHASIDDYCKSRLTRSSFENNYEEYEIRGDKNKNMSLHEYLNKIRPELEN